MLIKLPDRGSFSCPFSFRLHSVVVFLFSAFHRGLTQSFLPNYSLGLRTNFVLWAHYILSIISQLMGVHWFLSKKYLLLPPYRLTWPKITWSASLIHAHWLISPLLSHTISYRLIVWSREALTISFYHNIMYHTILQHLEVIVAEESSFDWKIVLGCSISEKVSSSYNFLGVPAVAALEFASVEAISSSWAASRTRSSSASPSLSTSSFLQRISTNTRHHLH